MSRFHLFFAAIASACTVEARAPFAPGDGIRVDAETGAISVDSSRVPDVPTCEAGRLLTKSESGWTCTVPPAADVPPTPGGGLVASGGGLLVDTGVVPLLQTCAAGELVSRSSSGWACVAPPKVPQVIGPVSLAAGDCISVRHGLGTLSVAPTIFRRAVNAARWMPDVLGYSALTSNVVLLDDKTAQTTGGLGGADPQAALDFSASTAWYGEVGATFTVDLGRRYSLDLLESFVSTPGAPDQTTDAEIQVSLDGVAFTSLARKQVNCYGMPSFSPQGAEARYIRWIGHAARSCPNGATANRVTLAGFNIVTTTPASAYRLVDEDTLELCNRFETRMDWIVIPNAVPTTP